VPYTFRWQPTREHLPIFRDVSIYELWFRFESQIAGQDDIRLTFEVKVGNPSMPRKVSGD